MSRVVMSDGGRLSGLCRLLAAAGLMSAACSSPQAPPPAAPAAPTAKAATAPAEAPTCVDAKDQRVQCLADSDCCPRFVCGKDPELSQSVTYCIFGG